MYLECFNLCLHYTILIIPARIEEEKYAYACRTQKLPLSNIGPVASSQHSRLQWPGWPLQTFTRVLLYIVQDEVEWTHCRKTEPKHKSGQEKKKTTQLSSRPAFKSCNCAFSGKLDAGWRLWLLHILQLTTGRQGVKRKHKCHCNRSQMTRILI